jgi:hypothetical protein
MLTTDLRMIRGEGKTDETLYWNHSQVKSLNTLCSAGGRGRDLSDLRSGL